MEKEINIAEILKDKPQGTKLYDLLRNIDVELDKVHITDVGSYIVCTATNEAGSTRSFGYSKLGTEECWLNGLQILFPSKEMRDWYKFAWKKGDVLHCGVDNFCIFEKWYNEDYTEFGAKFVTPNYSGNTFKTEKWYKETNEAVIKQYISNIEEFKGGKLNLATLEIEKQTEFKDGDILYITDRIVSCNFIMIYKNQEGDRIYHYATLPEDNLVIMTKRGFLSDNGGLSKRYATEEEKQQLFEALAKEGKAWDAEKKAIVDLKPKCEFKPFDRCIWKIRNCEGSIWQASFVSYVDEYGAIPMGVSIDEDLVNLIILPYNDQTKLLVGTTDEWKGGEQ